MKTIKKLFGLVIIGSVIFSCSSVKVVDSWNDLNETNLNGKNVMVVSQSEDEIVRKQFEQDLVQNLTSSGINSIESHKFFPFPLTGEELTEQELTNLKDELTESRIDIVVMTLLKDVKEYTKTVTEGGTQYHVYSYPIVYRRGFYRGYYRYYYTIQMNTEPVTYVTSKNSKYILETVIYDISKDDKDQLLSVITTEIDNPESLGTTSKDFSKKIVKTLVK